MPTYEVTWTCETEADSPRQAAEKAFEEMLSIPDGNKPFFKVVDSNTRQVTSIQLEAEMTKKQPEKDKVLPGDGKLHLEVTSVQVFPLEKIEGKLHAYARVSLNDELILTGLRILKGVNGLFVAYPTDPECKGEDYRQLFYPVTRNLRDAIETACLEKYQQIPKLH